MSGGCERRGGLGSLIASSNYTKKRAPRNGCRESGAPLACGLHGATFDPRAPACVQPVDQRVGRIDRRGGRHLDRAPLLPDRGVPHPVGEHREHAARRRFPVREQGDLRRRARDPAHGDQLLPPAGLCGAAARRDRRVPLGRTFDAQLEHREARDRWAHRYHSDDARHGVPQRQAARRAVCPAPRVSTRARGARPEDPDPAPALLRRARHGPLPPDDPRLGPDRDPGRALLGHGRQPRPVLRQPLLGIPAAVAHRGPAAHHLSERRHRPAADPLEPDAAPAPLERPVEPAKPSMARWRKTRGGVTFVGVLANEPKQFRAPDRSLIERIASGDERALGDLYDRHGRMTYALAFAIVRERADAEEVVVDAFGQAWRTAPQFDPARGTVAAWLATITRTRALDLLRARGRRARAVERAARGDVDGLAVPLGGVAVAPDREMEQREASGLVRRSLAELPEAQRRVIELAYFGGLTQNEIATELQEPLGTVKTRMRAGMEKLRGSLAPLFALEGP